MSTEHRDPFRSSFDPTPGIVTLVVDPTRGTVTTEHHAELALTTPMQDALDAHVYDYLTDNRIIAGQRLSSITVRDAIEHGWHGAVAEIAEQLDAIVAEARAEVAKRMPYPILTKLDELTEALKKSVGA